MHASQNHTTPAICPKEPHRFLARAAIVVIAKLVPPSGHRSSCMLAFEVAGHRLISLGWIGSLIAMLQTLFPSFPHFRASRMVLKVCRTNAATDESFPPRTLCKGQVEQLPTSARSRPGNSLAVRDDISTQLCGQLWEIKEEI